MPPVHMIVPAGFEQWMDWEVLPLLGLPEVIDHEFYFQLSFGITVSIAVIMHALNVYNVGYEYRRWFILANMRRRRRCGALIHQPFRTEVAISRMFRVCRQSALLGSDQSTNFLDLSVLLGSAPTLSLRLS
ncbi:hypothetical protein J6590_047598 [Homalodisca vitripennis]|nr:hypothetical protein J6590_047598 [Homalodisca vitripennis]